MQFDNQKTRNVADVVAKILAGESAKQEPQMLGEELVGNQHKIDANKNKKIDAHDFKLLRAQKDKEKANSQKFGKDVKEEVEELAESHFKVGDEVICKASGMEGEVVKVDPKGEGKYYTVKREDGKMIKYAPDELKKDEEEDEDEKEEMKEAAGASKSKEEKFHMNLDKLVHKTFGHSPAEKKEKMKEETEIDEAMFPGTKEYEKKFGQSPQQKLKKKGDTVPTSQGEMKKTEKGVVHTRRFSEMISAYQEQGLKYIAELSVEEEASQEEYVKEVKKSQNKSEGKEKAEVAKASVQAVKTEETHTKIQVIDMTDPDNIQKSEIDLEERQMTEPEMKKREDIVKGMKKGMAGFKQRYGERAKEVVYATATRMAKEKA